MTPAQIVRAAIPGAEDDVCEHVLWGMTPFPCGPITAQDIYRAASRLRRASAKGIRLCDWCHRIAMNGWTCEVCQAALARASDEVSDGRL